MLNSKEENGAKKKLQQQSRIDLKTVAQKIGASSGGEGGGTVGSTRTHAPSAAALPLRSDPDAAAAVALL